MFNALDLGCWGDNSLSAQAGLMQPRLSHVFVFAKPRGAISLLQALLSVDASDLCTRALVHLQVGSGNPSDLAHLCAEKEAA